MSERAAEIKPFRPLSEADTNGLLDLMESALDRAEAAEAEVVQLRTLLGTAVALLEGTSGYDGPTYSTTLAQLRAALS